MSHNEILVDSQVLYRVSQDIIGAPDLETTLRAIARGAFELIRVDLSVIRLIKEKDGSYAITDTFQYPEIANTTKPRLEKGEGVTNYVITSGDIFISQDISNDPKVNPELKTHDFLSQIVVPLILQDEPIGALYLYDKKRRDFTKNEQILLKTLANQAAIAVNQISTRDFLYQIIAQVSSATDLDTTLRAIARGAIELTHTTLGVIRRIRGDEKHYVIVDTFQHPEIANTTKPRLEKGEGITNYVITSGEIFISRDIPNDPQVNPELKTHDFLSQIVVPLILQDEPIGALYLYDKKRRDFTKNEQALLKTLANQAAIAITAADDRQSRQLFYQASFKLTEQLKAEQLKGRSGFRQVFADQMKQITEASYVSVIMLEHQSLRKVAQSGSIMEDPVVRKNGLSAHLMQSRQPLYVQDVKQYEREYKQNGKISINSSTIKSGIVTLLGLPLVISEISIGVVWLHFKHTKIFKPNEITAIQAYVNQAALIYHTIRKYDMSAELSKISRDRLFRVSERLDVFSVNKIAKSTNPLDDFWLNLSDVFPEICKILELEYGFIFKNNGNNPSSFLSHTMYIRNKEISHIEFSWNSISNYILENGYLSFVKGYKESIEPLRVLNNYIDLSEENHEYEAAILIITPEETDSAPSTVLVFINRMALTDEVYLSFELQNNLLDRIRSTIRNALYATFRLEQKMIEDRKRETLYFHLAHEIGTPLMGLTSSANALSSELQKTDVSRAAIADHMLKQAQKLYLMSETMLAAIGNPPTVGKMEFRKHNLFGPLMETFEMFEAEAKVKGCEIKKPYAINGIFPDMLMSIHDLTIAFKNLISNAVKYSFYPSPEYESERYIKITGNWENNLMNNYMISFQNYGVGITEEEIESRSIFRPFTRGINSSDRDRTGKGLGLAQVRFAIEDLHGGKISVKSRHLWGNAYLTTFTLILPLRLDSKRGVG